jgi:flagellar biogenesis protein FliO
MTLSFLISAIIVLLVVGLLCWCVARIPGLPAPIPTVVQILVVLAFAVWLLQHAGIFH